MENVMKYEIIGGDMPLLLCHLDDGEAMSCESGAMGWQKGEFTVKTNAGKSLTKMLSRAISGESVIQNEYIAKGSSTIAFPAEFSGSIVAADVTEKSIVICKNAFLCSESSVSSELFWQKNLSPDMFGAEGFILLKFSGSGNVFFEIDGTAVEYELAENESLNVSAGHLAAMSETCRIEIEAVRGMGNKAFGVRGLFTMNIKGPGHVWLQSMPRTRILYSLNNLSNT